MTDAELILWRALRRNRVLGVHFRRQQVIQGFIADFYCHAAGLVVEVDGACHQDNAEYDAERSRILEARGIRVLRVTNGDVQKDLGAVLRRIAELLEVGEGQEVRTDLTPNPFPGWEGA